MRDDESLSERGRGQEGKGRLLDWLEIIAKLTGALAFVWVAILANSLQSKLTGISLQSQREQADTQLRANMFNSLISPLVGSARDGKPLPAEREELLVELLALNFSEDFELKPIMKDVEKQLRFKQPSSRDDPSVDLRWPLWSVARRVADRQISSLSWKWTSDQSPQHGCEVFYLYLEPQATRSKTEEKTEEETTEEQKHEHCVLHRGFSELISLKSPDNRYELVIHPKEADWKNETIDMSIAARPLLPLGETENEHSQVLTYNFLLDLFSLPLTDNTILPDGNRFALTLGEVEKTGAARIKVIWFPKNYFTKRERPLDPNYILKLLGERPH